MVTSDTFVTMSRTKAIPAGEFKAKCLALLDDVEAHRHTYIVTKRGRPVARIVPIVVGARKTLRGSLLHEEGLLDPVDVAWDAAK